MTFVYRGAGKRQRPGTTDPCLLSKRCQRMACDIQWCLSRNNYAQAKCVEFIERWEECCEAAKARHAAEVATASASASASASAGSTASAGK